ncbi:serpentine type 7TM GPCR chemoreceptor srt domain-containing protein [Ditylenchus destructor]|uniref:Serpentine type 7TM GPCR chemoreceptor srt domain-containing protein n=1 Tax=Ditylenchus destructor TaxID=166010 RepID=A0AAD4R120_9BILA|nr:serpentine type 7TM GPCR chemoreceptor srt domain-containing protein [Ditylenchus destructor]
MSLNDFVFNRDEFLEKYNCSKYNVDIIPTSERRNILVGVLYITLGTLCEMVYLPCLWAIYQQIKLSRFSTCYVFMFYLGVLDTIGLFCSGFVCGIFSIKGIVFCQIPIFGFLGANIGMYIWFGANTTTLILAINRCMVIYDDDLADRFFKGRRGTMWLIIPTFVALICMWVSPPVFYNPMDSSAVFNPHRYYLPNERFFHSAAHVAYNWIIVLAIPTIYIVFAVFFANRLRSRGMMAVRGNRKLAREFSTFLQVLITSFFVMSTSLGFIYQEYLQSFPIFVFVGYIMYEGSPAFIYLCMNQSIRNTLRAKTNRIYSTSNFIGSNIPPARDDNTHRSEGIGQ